VLTWGVASRTTVAEGAPELRDSPASACTVLVVSVHNIPAAARQDVATSSQNGNGFLGPMSVASGRLSILQVYQPDQHKPGLPAGTAATVSSNEVN